MIAAREIEFRYGKLQVLRGVSVPAQTGEIVGLVGVNGAGKSTLLRIFAGLLAPARGTVELDGQPLASLPRREIARRIALVPQSVSIELPFSVREIVAMGRTPHLGRFAPLGARDRDAVEAAMHAADVAHLAERSIVEISDGERQRCLLARAFAQEAPLLLLDEPTASLDLSHAFALLAAVRERVRAGGAAITSMHDLGLAARTCDRLVVLHEGRVRIDARPAEALAPQILAEVLGLRTTLVAGPDGALSVAVLGARS